MENLDRSAGIFVRASRPNESGADLVCELRVGGLAEPPAEEQLDDLEARVKDIFLAVHGEGYVHCEATAVETRRLTRRDVEEL